MFTWDINCRRSFRKFRRGGGGGGGGGGKGGGKDKQVRVWKQGVEVRPFFCALKHVISRACLLPPEIFTLRLLLVHSQALIILFDAIYILIAIVE